MEVILSPQAIDDLEYWKKSGNKIVQKKIQQLLESIQETPFEGVGKPEGLKHNLSGSWSRRINHEHRVIYRLQDDKIIIDALRYHYK
jgi:toxin YoeB